MKNKILFAFASLFLVGCAQNNGLDIVKNAIDLTPSNEISKIQQGIVNLRNGLVFEGTLTRTRTFYKNSSFLEPIDSSKFEESDLKSESNLTFKFSSNAYYRKVEEYNSIAEDYVTYLEEEYHSDNKGRVYTEYLTAQNEVGKKYQKNGANYVTFESLGFDNPFYYINEKDIVLKDGKAYLQKDKASYIFNRLCAFYASGASSSPKECTVTLNSEDQITRITYIPAIRYVIEYDATSDSNSYYTIEQNYDFYILDAGKDSVSHLEKESDKGSTNKVLSKAFKKFDGNNITMVATDTDTSSEIKTTKTRVSYLDGSNAYIKYFDSSRNGSETELDAENDYVLTKNPNIDFYEARKYVDGQWIPSNKTKFGKVNQDKYKYDDLIPHLDGISSDLFTYDATTNTFICENSAVSEMSKSYFQSSAIEIQQTNARYATKVAIQLNSFDEIKTVTIDYRYADFFSSSIVKTGQIVFRYFDQGKTVLPYDASSKLGE